LDDSVLSALEYAEILHLLGGMATTPLGAAQARSLRPASEPGEVARENELTVEASRHLDARGSLPFGTLPDPDPLLGRLEIEGSVLAPLEILDLLTLMKAGRGVKAAVSECREQFPRLWEAARDLPDLGNLIRFLDGKIATTGALEDRASDDLRAVRHELERRNERLRAVLDTVVQRQEVARALQDDFISIRSERHVIPIRAEARSALPGIVHGVSGSGATVFVEPMETVDLNNEIVTLRDREAAEVQRLLQEYSDLARGRLADLRALARLLGRLDLVLARARLGRALRGRPAETAAGILLAGARHPLVESSLRERGGRIVPLDLSLPERTRVLVISGPNAGGKTVALKTLGLLALMHQSGLMVPAERAVLPVFRGIYIDIGDRQSIPDRLSTFSGRMQTIAAIASGLQTPGLVLLDELGSGTDPEDGVALGIAIAEHLGARGAMVVATTHLEALKAHAASTEGCANAAMEFDESAGAPTYRLIPGIPGRSGGLEIAERLGLPEAILQAARARRGRSAPLIAAYLARLQAMSADLEARLAEAEAERRRLAAERAAGEADLRARAERQRQAIAAEIEIALRTMREEGERYLSALKDREIAATLRREEGKAAARMRAEARRLVRRVSGAPPEAPAPDRLAPGAVVRVEALGVRGTVESVAGGRVVITVRGKRLTVDRGDCRPESAAGAGPPGGSPRLPRGVTLERRSASPSAGEIHLRGRPVDEALELVDKYLDDAYLAGLSPVRLVHGVGAGRLKRAIADLLSSHPHVEGFASAPADQGGPGVTVVRLKL
jgi:DNA mismatch repair protein MutS2